MIFRLKHCSFATPLAILLCGLAGGCAEPPADTTSTTAIDPSKIVSNAAITSNGNAATVELGWYVSGAAVLEVGVGDRLVVRAADAPARDLVRVGDKYFALLPTTSTAVTVALLRPTGELAFDVPLPAAFVVVGPTAPVSRSQPIALTWDPPVPGQETYVDLTVDSPCFSQTISRRVAKDTGAFTFYPGDFGSPTASCLLSIAVKRSGTLSVKTPWWMTIATHQVRTLMLETTP